MNVLFKLCINNYQSLTELRKDAIVESQKLATQATSKVKSGFVSLLNSISNSFASLQKAFSFSASNKKMNNDREGSIYLKTEPLVIVDNIKENVADYISSKPPRQDDFNVLKSEMHDRLNACFNRKVNA